ncbi:IS110 family transposase [Pontibacter russatus]|uniref:IS110 family transposase n=1 Tax=Pontibacter russatus TaxID=2694929 RepID=UPI00137A4102|nr:IS110 family transposase [Pontibacter russatus]
MVKASRKFSPPKGFAEASIWGELLYILEATGDIAWQLYQAEQKEIIVLPNRAKKYPEPGLQSKNDWIGRHDPEAERNLRPWQPLSCQLYLLRKLTREHEQVHQMRTEGSNHLHAATPCWPAWSGYRKP